MTTKYGMFKEHTYLRPTGINPHGDVNDDTAQLDATAKSTLTKGLREEGLNFKTTVGRTGKNNDATFSKFVSNNVGDKYVDPLTRTLQAKNEQKKAMVSTTPFKSASPMKRSTGKGDCYGTLSGKVEYVPGATITVQKTKEDVKTAPRGFFTNPAKKGTYGYNKTTLSERQGFKGVATEYEYQHEPEALDRARRLAEKEADLKARASSLPFRPANPPKRGGPGVPNTTISKGKGVVGEWEYVIGQDAKQQDPNAPKPAPVSSTPFKPASLKPKHLGTQAEYIHDPEVPKIEAEHAARRAEIQRLAASGPWRPNQSDKTDMTRSIVRMNL